MDPVSGTLYDTSNIYQTTDSVKHICIMQQPINTNLTAMLQLCVKTMLNHSTVSVILILNIKMMATEA
jgi:hypothetical protein